MSCSMRWCARGRSRRSQEGDFIYRRGDPGDSLMVVIAGRVKLANDQRDGKEVALRFSRRGRHLRRDRSARWQGAGGRRHRAGRCGRIRRLHARPVADAGRASGRDARDHPCAVRKVRAGAAIIEDNTLEMRARTAHGPAEAGPTARTKEADGVSLQLTISQEELGKYLWLSRPNVSRQLATAEGRQHDQDQRDGDHHLGREGACRDRHRSCSQGVRRQVCKKLEARCRLGLAPQVSRTGTRLDGAAPVSPKPRLDQSGRSPMCCGAQTTIFFAGVRQR